MATIIIRGRDGNIELQEGDDLIVKKGGSVSSFDPFYTTILGRGSNVLQIDGSVSGRVDDFNPDFLGPAIVAGRNSEVRVGSSGKIEGSIGVNLDANGVVENLGTIEFIETGIVVFGNASILNEGRILGIDSRFYSAGIQFGGGSGEIVNDGLIQAGNVGIGEFRRFDPDTGMEEDANDDAIVNNGTIQADIGISTFSNGGGDSLLNSGRIFADFIGISADSSEGGSTRIVNTGTIRSSSDEDGFSAISSGDGNETVINSGLLDGGVFLGGGDDVFRGSSGTVAGIVSGNDGDDLLVGNASDDEFFGGLGDDRLLAKRGDDVVSGGDGLDVIRASGGDDEVRAGGDADEVAGSAGDDTLLGEDGDDRIDGGGDDDTLIGGDGDDRLAGDRGIDVLSGGDGADEFLFSRGNGSDTVADFEDDIDTIVLDGAGLDVSEVEALLDNAELVGNVAILTFESGDTLIVSGVARLSDLRNDIDIA